jgi:peroxiredoxin
MVAVVFTGSLLLLAASQATALQVGDQAPTFTLPATTAETISLGDYLGKKPVVLFFYIAAFGRA